MEGGRCVELEQWECGEGPGEDKEGETGIRIYCMKEHLFSIKKIECGSAFLL